MSYSWSAPEFVPDWSPPDADEDAGEDGGDEEDDAIIDFVPDWSPPDADEDAGEDGRSPLYRTPKPSALLPPEAKEHKLLRNSGLCLRGENFTLSSIAKRPTSALATSVLPHCSPLAHEGGLKTVFCITTASSPASALSATPPATQRSRVISTAGAGGIREQHPPGSGDAGGE